MKLLFENLAKTATSWTGSTSATVLAFLTIIIWTIGGLFVGFGTDYQMYINTSTTIITFLMVFLLQRNQNKDSFASQMKLNELIASNKGASNRLINLEDLSEKEMQVIHELYKSLSKINKKDKTGSHSIEELL